MGRSQMPTVNEISLEKAKQKKKFLIQSTSKSHFIQSIFLNYYCCNQDDCH